MTGVGTRREIDGKDLRLGKLLGEGAFGKVYKGEYRYVGLRLVRSRGLQLLTTACSPVREEGRWWR
jgi:hypothetical protein